MTDDSFFRRITRKPPLLFPLVALFHVGLLVYYLFTLFPEPLWVQLLWIAMFTFAWIFVCDMKKWAAWLYVGITTLNLGLRLVLKSPADLSNFTDTLFPADILFSFFVLFYFRRFE